MKKQKKTASDLAGGQCRNVAAVRDRLFQIRDSLDQVGLSKLAREIENLGQTAWLNADALYCTILSMNADDRTSR